MQSCKCRFACDPNSVQPSRSCTMRFRRRKHEEGAMSMRPVIVIGTVLLAAGCRGPQSPPGTRAAESSQTVQLGGPPSGAGTLNADGGEIQPADPNKFYKEPGYSPYAGRRYPERP